MSIVTAIALSMVRVLHSQEKIVEPMLILACQGHRLHDLEHLRIVFATRQPACGDEAKLPLAALIEGAHRQHVEIIRQIAPGLTSSLS